MNHSHELHECKRCKTIPTVLTLPIPVDFKFTIEHKNCGILIGGQTSEEVITKWNGVMGNWDKYKDAFKD